MSCKGSSFFKLLISIKYRGKYDNGMFNIVLIYVITVEVQWSSNAALCSKDADDYGVDTDRTTPLDTCLSGIQNLCSMHVVCMFRIFSDTFFKLKCTMPVNPFLS